jgi:hypothetical protein
MEDFEEMKRKDKMFTFALTGDDLLRLKRVCAEAGINASQFVRYQVRAGLAQAEKTLAKMG